MKIHKTNNLQGIGQNNKKHFLKFPRVHEIISANTAGIETIPQKQNALLLIFSDWMEGNLCGIFKRFIKTMG